MHDEVGERIKERRKAQKMTQMDLAKKAGIKRTTISAAEFGTNNPSTSTLTLIAGALGCTVADLLGESPAGVPAAMELTAEERQLILNYRALNQQGRSVVQQVMAMAGVASQQGIAALADVGKNAG